MRASLRLKRPPFPMRRFAADYLEFFRRPDIARLITVSLVSRMPVGMVALGMLLFLREALGSYATAGTIVGVYFVAIAAGAPVQGRLMDRSGPRRVVAVTAVAHPLSLLAIFLLGQGGASPPLLALAAAMAGLFAVPILTLTRTLWRHHCNDEADRRRAFSLDAALVEINFTIGPAAIAILVGLTDPRVAFASAIGVTVVAITVFVTSGVLAHFRIAATVERHWLGPLRHRQLQGVFAATFIFTIAFGFLEVGYPAFGTQLGQPSIGGLLLASNSLGSAVAGAVFGGIALRAAVERQFAVTLGCMAIPLALHAFLDTTAQFAVAAFFTGMTIAPAIACQSVLVARLAPAHHATEAFTWSSTCIVAGLGTGLAFGGWLVDHVDVRAPFVTGAILAFGVSLALFLAQRRR